MAVVGEGTQAKEAVPNRGIQRMNIMILDGISHRGNRGIRTERGTVEGVHLSTGGHMTMGPKG